MRSDTSNLMIKTRFGHPLGVGVEIFFHCSQLIRYNPRIRFFLFRPNSPFLSDSGRVSAVANRKNDLDFGQSERFSTFFDPDGTRGRDKHSKPSSHEIPVEFPLSSALRWFDCKILTPKLETIPLKILKIYFLMNLPEFQYLIVGNFKVIVIHPNSPCSEALKIK